MKNEFFKLFLQTRFLDSFDWSEAVLPAHQDTFSKLPNKCSGGQPAIISNKIQFDLFTQKFSQVAPDNEIWLGIKLTSTGWQLSDR